MLPFRFCRSQKRIMENFKAQVNHLHPFLAQF